MLKLQSNVREELQSFLKLAYLATPIATISYFRMPMIATLATSQKPKKQNQWVKVCNLYLFIYKSHIIQTQNPEIWDIIVVTIQQFLGFIYVLALYSNWNNF